MRNTLAREQNMVSWNRFARQNVCNKSESLVMGTRHASHGSDKETEYRTLADSGRQIVLLKVMVDELE